MEKAFMAYNLTCDSCREIISRTVESFPGAALKSVDLQSGAVVLDCADADFENIKAAVYSKGYGPARTVSKSSVHHLIRGVLGNDSAFAAERKILEFSIGSLLVSLASIFILAWMLVADKAVFWSVYSPLLFMLGVGISATVAALSHMSYFRTGLSMMTGMMVGMTIGMASGFMIGALVGATNGMFVGSLAGMLVGMGLGAWAGRCCGVMGVMEGLMAGLMSGTMGAMLSVMMLREPILPFLFILSISCVAILVGLSYTVFKEAGHIPQEAFRMTFYDIAVVSLIASIALTLLMVIGPKSAVVIGV